MIDNKMFNLLAQWVTAREEARLGNETGAEKPWTEDLIVQNYRFCNVDRNNDTVTKWIHENITWNTETVKTTWFNLVLARFINYPYTMEKLCLPWTEWDESTFLKVLDEMQQDGQQVYNGAYMIRGGTGEDAGVPKHHYLARRTFTPIWEARSQAPDYGVSIQEWSDWFKGFFGMGDFMRNQVLTDMRYGPLDTAPDWTTFILPGPGTSRGLNRLHKRELMKSVPLAQRQEEVLEVRDRLAERFPSLDMSETWEDPNNTSNCLCELDKYCRVWFKEKGRPKSRYAGIGDRSKQPNLKPSQVSQLSNSALKKQRAAVANREELTCPKCGKTLAKNMYVRWGHGEDCKK